MFRYRKHFDTANTRQYLAAMHLYLLAQEFSVKRVLKGPECYMNFLSEDDRPDDRLVLIFLPLGTTKRRLHTLSVYLLRPFNVHTTSTFIVNTKDSRPLPLYSPLARDDV